MNSLINCPPSEVGNPRRPEFIRREDQGQEGLVLGEGVESRPGCPPFVTGELPKFTNRSS